MWERMLPFFLKKCADKGRKLKRVQHDGLVNYEKDTKAIRQ